MKALLQRVTNAKVEVGGKITGKINQGLLVFVGIEKHDEQAQVDKMVKRLLAYRVFYDANQKMNLSVKEVSGGILLVSQFTLAADTSSGTRAGFSSAKPPAQAEVLFDYFLTQMRTAYHQVASGVFGADMQAMMDL